MLNALIASQHPHKRLHLAPADNPAIFERKIQKSRHRDILRKIRDIVDVRPCRIHTAQERAHARAGQHIDRQTVLQKGLDHADMRKSSRRTGSKDQA